MTLPTTLSAAIKVLKDAKCPEDIFGDDERVIPEHFRSWAKLTHEDRYTSPKQKLESRAAFQALQVWRERADAKCAKGTYGDKKPTVTCAIKTKANTYVLTTAVASGDICDVYDAFDINAKPLYVKVPRLPTDSDLMQAEVNALREMNAAADRTQFKFLPQLVDSVEIFSGKDKRRANVFVPFTNTVTFAQVHAAIPALDPRDAAWMFNRMIDGLFVVHSLGYVHGAVTPDHFLIEPPTHLGLLVDYCQSVKRGQPIRAISNKWKAFYPPEVFDKKPAGPGTDIYMAATCMIYLLGGDPVTGKMPDTVPTPIRGLLRACRLKPLVHRMDDAFELHKEFDTILRALYGPKKFRVFEMPKAA